MYKENRGEKIGVVGGLGPHAGVDLVQKIFANATACTDNEYPVVMLVPVSGNVPNRSDFLLGHSAENPAKWIIEAIRKLEMIEAGVIGIPCNTSHAHPIFDVVMEYVESRNGKIRLIHMIQAVGAFLLQNHRHKSRVGILCTMGSHVAGIYHHELSRIGYEAVSLEEAGLHSVHDAIHNRVYGLKACAHPVTPQARRMVEDAIAELREKGAELVVLGCTELPLALRAGHDYGVDILDATRVLAKALIDESNSDILKKQDCGIEIA